MVRVNRRTLLTTGAGAAIGATPQLVDAGSRLLGFTKGPAQIYDRIDLPTGAQSGDVTATSAVLWARSARPSQLLVRLSSNGRVVRSVRGAWTDERRDYTAKLALTGLAPGREYDATIWFADHAGRRSRPEQLSFRTAPIHPAPQSFVWSGDTCGQSWGINAEVGGFTGYRAMQDVRPDFFIHAGDHIYADETVEEAVLESDGHIWRNVVTEELTRPAQSLRDYRGRYRYVLSDEHVRRFHADVPQVSMWDDHETANNWYPGWIYPDDRYSVERRCDVLARYGRQAWQEYLPIADADLTGRGGDGFASRRIYRKISRGAHLDVFCLDMRSFRDPNTLNTEPEERSLLGKAQADWLIRSVAASKATWKCIVADLPLSVIGHDKGGEHYEGTGWYDAYANTDDGPPLGREHELARVLSAFQAAGVTNFFFLTADVHYTAAHHYLPERAAYQRFDEFWEFVSGPIQASTFGVKPLDQTFGPEIVFAKGNDGISQSPRQGNQFFGQVEIAASGELTVNLRNVRGQVLWTRTFTPAAG